jgi:hypothetical protein
MSVLVPPVEEVHERACEQEQVRQDAEDMRRVLGNQKEPPDPEKHEEHERRA